ncbi:hypothetical protein N2384_28245 [Bacillus paralicheniformis]|nr:hypothetical protein [Bacillus paralicheniformis]UWS61739.1 hypothetical protein N2384_28245 [Bacillus paralicheniformis]
MIGPFIQFSVGDGDAIRQNGRTIRRLFCLLLELMVKRLIQWEIDFLHRTEVLQKRAFFLFRKD